MRYRWCLIVLLATGPLAAVEPDSIDSLLSRVRSVGHEASHGRDAALAVQRLAAGPPSSLLTILRAYEGANPLAANYLRAAVEELTDRATRAKLPLPVDELTKFSQGQADPRARRLAFELVKQVEPARAAELIPSFLNDASLELRREAVAQLMARGEELLPDAQDAASAKEMFRQAFAAARDEDQVQSLVKHLEDLGEKVDLNQHFGFVNHWRLIGPFDNSERGGFERVYPPETQLDLAGEYVGKGASPVRWQDHATEDRQGIVDLNKLKVYKGAVMYAVAEFHSPAEREAEIRLGTPNAWKLWVNQDFIFGREEYHRNMALDQYRVPVTLRAGRNTFLLKVCQNEQSEQWAQRWQFQLRVCDRAGTAIASEPPANER